MKRKNNENVDAEPKLKKKATSETVAAKEFSKKKSQKNSKESQSDSSRLKKGKFEKATQLKKFDKKKDKFRKIEKTSKQKIAINKDDKTKTDAAQNTEKPNWLEFKKQKKELKEKRKAKKLSSAYDAMLKAKRIGEKLRRADCTKENREKLTDELYELLKGQFSKLVFTHDLARIIQWLLKYCKPEIRKSIFSELSDSIVPMLQSKYAKNCVKTLLKCASDEIRAAIIAAFSGHVVKLVSHGFSAPIVELAYSTWATEENKIQFKQEFYGDMYKQAKDGKVKTLADTWKYSSDMKTATLAATKANLLKILNKKLINSTLVHTVLYEFLTNCSSEDASEIIVMLRSLVVELSKTKHGTRVAMICFWHGTTKDRKASMKALKEHIKSLATNEYGYLVLLALFDCVDDTVLVKKMILAEIQNDLTEIAANEYGRRVILYLVARRDLHYFHPQIVKELEKGDGNSMSKKPAEVRAKELLDACINIFLKSISTETKTWLASNSISMVTLAILKSGDNEEITAAHSAIVDYLNDPESVIIEGEVSCKAIESCGLHMMLKKLIQHDKVLLEKQKPTFGEVVIKKLTADHIKDWIEYNRGCFLLITLIENGSESSKETLLSKLKPFEKALKSKKTPGASILMKKLK